LKEPTNRSHPILDYHIRLMYQIIILDHYIISNYLKSNDLKSNYLKAFLDGYCSTVQGLLDWFEVDLGSPELVLFGLNSASYDSM